MYTHCRPAHQVVHVLKILSSEVPELPAIPLAKSNGHTCVPHPSALRTHPEVEGRRDARLTFVGNATTMLEWEGVRLLTDPNFVHAGERVRLAQGVIGTRLTEPAFPIEDRPPIDVVLLSDFNTDHFDQEVQDKLRKDINIITTTCAKERLMSEELDFTHVYGLKTWQSAHLNISPVPSSASSSRPSSRASVNSSCPSIRVTATPGRHAVSRRVGSDDYGNLDATHLLTHGFIIELGYNGAYNKEQEVGFTIYVSGDTVMIDDLRDIPTQYPSIDLLLIHLGGMRLRSIPTAKAPLVTMDAKQGIELIKVVNPKVVIPIHFDDYDVFASPLSEFKKEVEQAGLGNRAVYLDRGEAFDFGVRRGVEYESG